jgi:hypothetical protein
MTSLGRELASLRNEIKLLRHDMGFLRRRALRHESATRTEHEMHVDAATHVEWLVSAAAESTAMLPDEVAVDSLFLHELEVYPEHRPPALNTTAEFKSSAEEERSLDSDTHADRVDRAMESLQLPSHPNQMSNPNNGAVVLANEPPGISSAAGHDNSAEHENVWQ